MVDEQISATSFTFLLDLGIFILYVLVFFAIRGTRGDKDVMLPNWRGGDRDLNTARFTSRDLRLSSVVEEEDANAFESNRRV